MHCCTWRTFTVPGRACCLQASSCCGSSTSPQSRAAHAASASRPFVMGAALTSDLALLMLRAAADRRPSLPLRPPDGELRPRGARACLAHDFAGGSWLTVRGCPGGWELPKSRSLTWLHALTLLLVSHAGVGGSPSSAVRIPCMPALARVLCRAAADCWRLARLALKGQTALLAPRSLDDQLW